MRKNVIIRLVKIIFISLVFSLALNYLLQLHAARQAALENSKKLFWQVEQILDQNEAEAAQTQENFTEMCRVRARAAAYILQGNDYAFDNQVEIRKIARLLQVDEIHIFDSEGTLYAGSDPQYYGLNFNSDKQMQFFLPMLEDKSLELCQGIETNAAEQKPMQYCAVWCKDKKNIVQIGMAPERVLEAMKKVQLSYIFSLLTVDSGASIYAIDEITSEILGSTDDAALGKNAIQLGFDPVKMQDNTKVHNLSINGQKCCCVFQRVNSMILARVTPGATMYQELNRDTALVALYLLLLAAVIILFITHYLDRNIIDSIYSINRRMHAITQGDLDVRLSEQPTPELTELGCHVNEMVNSLLNSTQKISLVLDTIKLPIGVYEFHPGMRRVIVTSRVRDILRLTDGEADLLLSDSTLFEQRILSVCRHPFDKEKGIYHLPGHDDAFVRLESFVYEKSTLGILIDVSQDIIERRHIERERDIDDLTGLYNRRAFYVRMDSLLQSGLDPGHAAMMMMDLDNLKVVNDRFGHQCGDRYLSSIAGLLRDCSAQHKVVARLSGDEFVVFLYGCETREEMTSCIDEIQSLRDRHCVELDDNHNSLPVRFSLGCAFYGSDGNDYHMLMKTADDRMYEEKKRRKEESA